MKDTNFVWPEGKRAGLSLTFDDARHSQIDQGIPILDAHGIRATFYVSPYGVRSRLEDWQRAVAAGHEIGNHTRTHPCSVNFDFVGNNPLEDYTLDRMEQELVDAGDLIEQALGIRPTTFAYPCGQKFVGRGIGVQSYVPLVAKSFLAGRGYRDQNANDPSVCDLAQLLGRDADNWPAATIKTWIDEAVRKGLWLILVGHAVGGPSPLGIATEDLEELCRYASDPELGLWVDSVASIAGWIANSQNADAPAK